MDTQNPQDDELDLLDLLVTLAESWKLLIFGPLLAGIAALGISFLLPKTFESKSSLQVERAGSSVSAPTAASLAMSADVLRKIAPAAGLDANLSAEEIYKKLSNRINVSVGKQDKLLSISTQASTPETAQHLNQMMLDTLFTYLRPRGSEKTQLEKQLALEKNRQQEATKLEHETAANIASNRNISDATSRLYGELLTSNSRRQASIQEMERRLGGLDADDIIQSPTLPERQIKPKKSLLAIGSAIAAGLVLLLFVFARQALRNARESSPEQAEKLTRIRQALSW